jgi:hypothetical protein
VFFLIVCSVHRAIIKNVKKLNLIINASAYDSVKFLVDNSGKSSKSVLRQYSENDEVEENEDILSEASSSRCSSSSSVLAISCTSSDSIYATTTTSRSYFSFGCC